MDSDSEQSPTHLLEACDAGFSASRARACLTHKAVDIGEGRSRVVVARNDSLSFVTFEPRPGGGFSPDSRKSVNLTPRSAKILGERIYEISNATQAQKAGTLSSGYREYLGQGFFIIILPGNSFVLLRRYYRPQEDPASCRAGFPYFVFKFKEFDNFLKEWPDLARIMALHKLPESCTENSTCGDESCEYCKF